MCNKKELEMYLKFRNHIDSLFFPEFSEECEIIGAYEGEKEIGFMCVINGYIEGIWVEPEYRRRGKARQMVFEYILSYEMPQRLHILKNNEPAIKFWNSIFDLRKVEETNIDILYSIIGLKEMESD